MPYVKVKTVPRNQQPVHPAPPPISQVAQTILQLAAHQQVLEAEISQIVADVAYLEDANKRYANIAASSPPSSPSTNVVDISVSSVGGVASKSPTPNQLQQRGGAGVKKNDAAAIQKCFSGQIAKLKAMKISKEATLKDVSQYLQLHQLHGASGDRLLRRVEKDLVTPLPTK